MAKKKKDSPKVSVCIPTYNNGHFISDAIDSILAQTFSDLDLIVIDNCSSDDTKFILEEYINRDDRVRYLCNKSNLGFAKNLNRCLDYSSGKYVKIVCSDDILEPNCLEEMVKVLDNHPEVSLVASARKLVDEHLNPVGLLSFANHFGILKGQPTIKKCLVKGNLIGEPTAVLFRKKDVDRGFNLKYRQVIDLEMWFYLLEKGDFAFIPEALCMFRQHPEQETLKNLKSVVHVDDVFALFLEYSSKPHLKLTFFQNLKAKFNIANVIWCFSTNISYKKEKITDLFGTHGLLIYHLLSFLKNSANIFRGKQFR